jgi:phage N-6-adenine-methyltransferase
MAKLFPENIDRNAWRTPLYIFEDADCYFQFGLDAAASDQNRLCDQYFTKENSALDKDWSKVSKNVWCNPPYSRGLKELFIKKAVEESKKGVTTVFFLPALPSERWFPWDVSELIVFIRGRVNFLHPETGVKQSGVATGSCYCVISDDPQTKVRAIDREHIEYNSGYLLNVFDEALA